MVLGRCVESLVGMLCVGGGGDRLPGSDSDVWYEDQN